MLKSDIQRLAYSKDIEDHLSVLQSKLESLINQLSSGDLDSELPIIQHHLDQQNGHFLSLSLLCHAQEKFSVSDYLYDLFRYHLIQGTNQHPSAFHHITFTPAEYGKPLYLAHLVIMIRNERHYDEIEFNLPIFLKTLERGINNYHFAQSVINKKNFVPDQKGNLIFDGLIRAIDRYPEFTEIILNESSLFMPQIREIFSNLRNPKRVASIICTLAYLRKKVRESPGVFNNQPRIHFRLMPMTLRLTFGEKNTLGLSMAISSLDHYQLFNDSSVLQAVRTYFPDVQAVKGSLITYKHPQDFSLGMYIELEKKNGEPFTRNEMGYLKKHLPRSLEASIEDVVPSIFMISNEEEIMKNIIILRNEIESVKDLTQVMINFERQSYSHLTFVVILVRILGPHTTSLAEKFSNLDEGWEYIPERVRIVSMESDKITKEAHVFRLRLKKSRAFVRTDSSVNLNQARQYVVDFLKEKLGPIRDYTGSLIDLQNLMFRQFKENNRDVLSRYPNVLEDFFYTITPAEVKITLPLGPIETLFDHFLELAELDTPEQYVVKCSESGDLAFAMLRLQSSYINQLDQKIRTDEALSPALISNRVKLGEHTYIGYIYRGESVQKREHFFQQIRSAIMHCVQEEQGKQVLRLGTSVYPTSLDPRLTLFPTTNYIFKLLFDGLMRINAEGVPVCAVAESYTLSADRKTYTFHLRKSYWNNGDLVTAHDFAYAWEKVLSPSFSTPFAYLFFPIKNAKAVKKGELPADALGVYAEDPRTLVVELEYPVSHFLLYLALNIFYPVNRKIDRLHPDWCLRSRQEYVCNGPFTLEKVVEGQLIQLERNKNYWDHQNIPLPAIDIVFADLEAIYQKFRKGEIHWLGAPFTPWQEKFKEFAQEKKTLSSSSTLNLIHLNTESSLFKNKKIRQAFKLALNLKELLDEMGIEAEPAYTPISTFSDYEPTENGNTQRANQLFQEGLAELNLSLRDVPQITIIHSKESLDIRVNMLAKMQSQIKSALGVDLIIEILPWRLAYQKTLQVNFQLAMFSWKFLSNTPFYFLDTFEALTPLFRWLNEGYRDELRNAHREDDPLKQFEKLRHIEAIMEEEVPLIPLYTEVQYYTKNERLEGVAIENKIGAVDFKNAYFKSVTPDMNQLVKWFS